ncbi:PREDICTED: RING-H2 finger protein ATL48-like [Camelina sativa]|uniref:RING-type E3 ubiquitin transferase n=1 Tax=Camelina sativa TaxID=90675 RepID=A0ABM0TGY2_CAMSA|nr:PREDICTED: RING-H2 finger protein ATL48-like [Camelina sativa]
MVVEKMSAVEPDVEDLFQEKKRVRNPLVPLGALMTAGVLTAGLISFRRGNSQLGQVLMRARVVVQGATVALMVGTAYYYGDNPWKKLLLSEIHETEALSPKTSSEAAIALLNQKDSSSSSIISVLCLVISVLALIIIFLGVLHLIFKFLRKSSMLFPYPHFSPDPDPSSSSSPQLQHLFFLHDSGLDQTAIDALPVFLYGDVTMSLKESFDCAVCLSEFSDADKLRLLPVCGHAFHLHCMDMWLLSNSSCPLCRRSLSTSTSTSNFDSSSLCFNHAETPAATLSEHQQVNEGKVSISKRVFSVRLGRFKSTNGSQSQSQRHEVRGEIGVGVPRRCYSMGTHQYLECNQDFVVALSSSLREGNTSNNCSVHAGKSVNKDSGGLARF